MSLAAEIARVAKLADALDLGSCAFGRGGSTPPSRIFFLPPVFIDEFDDRCAVIQSMHMSDSGFDDHVHGAPQCSIALLQQQGIFLNGNNVVSISADVQKRD